MFTYRRELPSFPDLPHVINAHGAERGGTKRVYGFIRDVPELPHHCLAQIPGDCIGHELLAGIGHANGSPARGCLPVTHELLRSCPIPEVKRLADFPSGQDPLDTDGTLAILMLARLEFAFGSEMIKILLDCGAPAQPELSMKTGSNYVDLIERYCRSV
jgi:hypothetical protein